MASHLCHLLIPNSCPRHKQAHSSTLGNWAGRWRDGEEMKEATEEQKTRAEALPLGAGPNMFGEFVLKLLQVMACSTRHH